MKEKLSSINKLFKETKMDNSDFWKHLGVSIGKINDFTIESCSLYFGSLLKNQSLHELEEFERILNLEEKTLNKSDKIERLYNISPEIIKEILILKDFLSRKKKSVITYYNSVSNKFDTTYQYSQIIQLKHLLDDSVSHMISLYTLHHWLNKSTGIKYSLSKNISFQQALSIPTQGTNHLIDELYKKSNKKNNYRIFSYTSEENRRVIVLLYRQINDTSIPDFDEPTRNKEIAQIMFEINTEEGILEIRSKFQNEKKWIKEYIEENFNTSLVEVQPDLFEDYDPNVIKSAFLEGESPTGDETMDFNINKISFRSSPLINSPKLSFSLENGDVFLSVKDAYNRECIDLESLKDIESITFKLQNVSRTIRSSLLTEGNILFLLNDSGIDIKTKEQIEDNFFRRFGIPLNKLISNTKFEVGKADVTDFLMTLSIKKDLTQVENDIFSQLKHDEIIQESIEENIYCKNSDCDYIGTYKEDVTECPTCGFSELATEKFELLETSPTKVRSFIKGVVSSFCESTEWEIRNEPEKTFFSKKYKFINLVNKTTNESFEILINKGSIQRKFIEKINRSLTPTVIVFTGVLEKHLTKYDDYCIFPVNFGRIYNSSNPKIIFEQIYELIELRSKSYLSSVANKSFEVMKDLPAPEDIGDSYTPYDFEDDVFNVLKDIFPNADKWGSNITGKEVPEGIFTITFTIEEGAENSNRKYVFSYDCKLNKNTKGYDLTKGEQRKGLDYVEMLNQIRHITKYSTKNQLSTHIFISNNFNENNFKTMADHFYKKLPEKYDSRPIFLPLKILLYLHSQYRKNYAKINNSRNIFMEQMYGVLTTDKLVVKKEEIDNVMSQALDEETADYHDLNTKKVKESVLQKK